MQLFSRRGYAAVTVREIAAEAGVSHALVHRYLGTKEEIYRATLRRHESAIRDVAPAGADLLEATALMLREAVGRQSVYLRLLAHSALHGLAYERTSGRFAATERLVGMAEALAAREGDRRDGDAPDPRFVIASLVAMLLGWAAARDWVLPAAGLGDMEEDEFVRAFEKVALDLERLYFPTLRSGSDG
jgi:AcrR family transcriptional regulator